MLRNENIICLSIAPWDSTLKTRKHPLMKLLAMVGNNVLYVEPVLSIVAKFRKRHKGTLRHSFYPKLTREYRNLSVLTPPFSVPFSGSFRIMKYLNHLLLRGLVRIYQKRLRLDNPILWTYHYDSSIHLKYYSEKLSIYDCVDNMVEYPWLKDKEYVKSQERQLIRKIDVVFVTAKKLLEEKSQYNPNTFLVPNGVNVALFSKSLDPALEKPKDIKLTKQPIAGFVGSIDSWIDTGLIKAVAHEYPKISVVLIGPVGKRVDISEFFKLPNIHLLGMKRQATLPRYIKFMDVCMIPFKLNKLTMGVNPLKVYEYLAAGKPVVSTDIPEIVPLRNVVYISHSRKEFLENIKKALWEDNESKTIARYGIAKEYSWENILEKACCRIEYLKNSK